MGDTSEIITRKSRETFVISDCPALIGSKFPGN